MYVEIEMNATDSVHDVVSLADCRSDIESGGRIATRAMERVANFIRESMDDSVSVHISYEVEEGVDREGNRTYRTDFDRIRNIELVAQSFSDLDSDVLRQIHLATGLKAETEYDDAGPGRNVFRYRLKNE